MESIKIYRLLDPNTNEVRYVGKTIQILKYRLSGHICESKRTRSNHRNCWIFSLLENNQIPIIELIENVDEENWREREKYWIKQYKDSGIILVNSTDGGDGGLGCKQSEYTKKKRSNTIKRLIAEGIIDYTERAKKISKAHVGKIVSEETREKLRQCNLGKKYSKETLIKKSNGGVIQIDKETNEIIATYLTLTEAQKATGFFRGNISSACTGRLKTYKGFVWKYGNEDIVDTD